MLARQHRSEDVGMNHFPYFHRNPSSRVRVFSAEGLSQLKSYNKQCNVSESKRGGVAVHITGRATTRVGGEGGRT